jgi:hypothetical protein
VNDQEKEPRWRTVLCWGSTIIFLSLPPVLLVLQILDHLTERDVEVARAIGPFYWSIAGVVSALAGLGTLAAIRNGKK